jgi:hypothetical protein
VEHQYGGHHLAVNVTLDGEDMTLAPTLWGAQPASYEAAGTTTEPLSGETTEAFAVIGALDATQQDAAILDSNDRTFSRAEVDAHVAAVQSAVAAQVDGRTVDLTRSQRRTRTSTCSRPRAARSASSGAASSPRTRSRWCSPTATTPACSPPCR